MEKLDQLKQELVQEIKDLAADIAKSNSYIGLLSNEIKLRSLSEKFINLKFLERKRIGLVIFEAPIQIIEEKEEVFSTTDERYDDELAQEFIFEDKKPTQNTDVEDVKEIDSDFEENVLEFSEDRIAAIENTVEIEESINVDKKEEINDSVENQENTELKIEVEDSKTNNSTSEVEDFYDLFPHKSNFPKIQIDFNDRIAFLNQLFNGDSESMGLVINTLNHMESLSDSKFYLKDLKKEMDWADKEEYLERLEELVIKRFD